MEVPRCTEGGDAPTWRGATTEDAVQYSSREERREPRWLGRAGSAPTGGKSEYRAGRVPEGFHGGLRRSVQCQLRQRLAAAATLIVLALLVPACARKAPVVVPGPDRYPDFSYPMVPADLAKTAGTATRSHDLAWRALQSGDPRAAERGFSTVLQGRADFYPSETGLGYVEVARGNHKRALERFDRVVARAPAYLPALLGRAQTLLALERTQDALTAFEAVLAVDPSLAEVRRRVDALRFRAMDESLAAARTAEQAGQFDKARSLYERAAAASPESAFLYRELARIDRRLNRHDDAIEHATKAVTLDPSDGAAHLLLADVYESREQWDQAIAALERAQDLEVAPGLEARLQALRDRLALARLPEEYRAIPQNDRLTRGELAALIGIRFEPLLRNVRAGQSVLVTDIRNHWAQPWIMPVARARVMEVFENHTFQPRNVVRRGDLARAVSALLTLVAQRDPALGRRWSGARVQFADLGAGNLYYPAASLAVVAGVLDTVDGKAFQAGRVISGAEAIDALDRLQKIAASAKGSPRG
jgi:tetratricopeptide (TPR) repeat protein